MDRNSHQSFKTPQNLPGELDDGEKTGGLMLRKTTGSSGPTSFHFEVSKMLRSPMLPVIHKSRVELDSDFSNSMNLLNA